MVTQVGDTSTFYPCLCPDIEGFWILGAAWNLLFSVTCTFRFDLSTLNLEGRRFLVLVSCLHRISLGIGGGRVCKEESKSWSWWRYPVPLINETKIKFLKLRLSLNGLYLITFHKISWEMSRKTLPFDLAGGRGGWHSVMRHTPILKAVCVTVRWGHCQFLPVEPAY